MKTKNKTNEKIKTKNFQRCIKYTKREGAKPREKGPFLWLFPINELNKKARNIYEIVSSEK